MAPKKKTPKSSAKTRRAEKVDFADELKTLANHLPEQEAARIFPNIDLNARILLLNQQADALQAELSKLLEDHPTKEAIIAEEYYHLARRFTNALNNLEVTALAPVAEENDDWPMMVGRATRERISSEQEKFLKQIQLGKKLSRPAKLRFEPGVPYPPEVAFLLAAAVRSLYAERVDDSKAGFCLAKVREAKFSALPSLARMIKGTLKWEEEHAARLKTALAKLEPLSKETLDAWIEASLAVFVCMTKNAFESPRYPFTAWTKEQEKKEKNKRGVIIDRLRDALSSAFRMARNR